MGQGEKELRTAGKGGCERERDVRERERRKEVRQTGKRKSGEK